MTEIEVPLEENFETKILEVLSSHPKGTSHKILSDSIPTLNNEELVNALNNLLSQHKVQLLQKGNQLVYKLKGSVQKYQGADIEEKIIFEAVERVGSNGISSKDIKFQCRLPLAQVNKILKSLQDKKLIKRVTSKKLCILYDLEPSQAITGGTFCSGEEFESEFVDVLGDQCYRYLLQAKGLGDKLQDPISQRNASFKSSKDICAYINGLKISKVNLSLKDIESVLESLIYDDKIEKSVTMSKTYSSKNTESENLYRASKPLIGNGGVMMVPCGVCKVYQDCHIGGDVSPATCEYMRQWLDF